MRSLIPIYSFVLILFLVCSACSTAKLSGQPPLKKGSRFHVYLLMGQSNMAGRGVVEAQDQQIHGSVWMLDKHHTWIVAKEPMHFDKPIAGVGPGLSFGKSMTKADKHLTIGLVPSAVGGSSIDAWKVGGYHDQTNSYPYDEAIKRAKIASQTGEIKGIIWHQGESDSKPGQVESYAQKLSELIKNLRQELHAPNLPFVVATLPDFYVSKVPEAAQINQVLENLPNKVPYTACISTADLTHKGDTIHFDSPSARELGKRYAKAMQALLKITSTQ